MSKSSQPLPSKIGRYEIRDMVGRGGMGVLYCAFDPVLDREVAVKVMLADFSPESEQMRTRFYREARAAARLQHRNIVTVFEFAEEANQPHIVMEFLRGKSLASRMTMSPPLTLEEKVDIVAQLCSGLAYAHSQGVIHRDVKPANVFLLDDGGVKLLDFGIAKLTSSTLTQQGDVLGSVPYMSPEQLMGSESVDARADVWSTGVLLFELLTGRKPFEADSMSMVIDSIMKRPPLDLEALAPDVPKVLVTAVGRALEKKAAMRTRSAEDLGRELQLILKALQAARAAAMAELGNASTYVVPALHDGRLGEVTDVAGSHDLIAAPDKRTVLNGEPAAGAGTPSGSKTWMIAAGIAAVLALGAFAAWKLNSPSAPAGPANVTASAPSAGPASAPATTAAPATVPEPPPVPTPQTVDKSPAETRDAQTAPTSRRKASAEPPPAAAAPPKTTSPAPSPSPSGAAVEVSMSAAYPFEVRDGGRLLSASATSHDLGRQPNGKTLRVQSEKVFLDQAVRVSGADGTFEYSPPGLGKLDIRSARGDCKILVGKRDLGFGPVPPIDVVAGDYQVSLACPDGQNPQTAATVLPGRTARAYFTK